MASKKGGGVESPPSGSKKRGGSANSPSTSNGTGGGGTNPLSTSNVSRDENEMKSSGSTSAKPVRSNSETEEANLREIFGDDYRYEDISL